jgi:hypothetical protein
MRTFVCSSKFFTRNGVITSTEATLCADTEYQAQCQWSTLRKTYLKEYNEENPENPIQRFTDTMFEIK